MSTVPAYQKLIDTVDTLRRRWRLQKLLEGCLLVTAGAAGVLVAVVAADNLLRPDTTGRLLLAAALWGTLAVAVLNWVVNRWLDDRRDDFFAALAERGHPDLHDRLINALQLGRVDQPGYSPQLVERIVEDAAGATAGVDFSDSLDTRPAKRAAACAGAAVLLMGLYALVFAPRFFNGLARVLLPAAEVAPYTATHVLNESIRPGNHRVAEGTTVAIQARVDGVVPASAELLRRTNGGPWVPAAMKPAGKEAGLFGASIPQATESFDYQVVAGDGRSQTFRVEVVKRPRVAGLAVAYTPPAYTGKKPHRVADSDGEIIAVAGTAVVVELHATKPLKDAALVTEQGETLAFSKGADGRTWAASFLVGAKDMKATAPGKRVNGPSRYQIKLLDSDGYESADPLWRSVVATKDTPPVVTIPDPGRDLQVKPGAVVPITVDAKDDYGVGPVRLVYRVNDETAVEELAAFAHDGPPALGTSDRFSWTLSGPKLKPGALVQYWAVAADRNTVTGPGTAESRRFSVFITSPEQAVARLDTEISDYAKMLESLLRLQKENRAQTASGGPFDTLLKRETLVRTNTGRLARAMEKAALPVQTIVEALDTLSAGLMADAVKALETGRDAAGPARAAEARNGSLPVQDKIVAELEILLARLQRNEQAKEALRKMAKTDKPGHQATVKVLGEMIKDLDRLTADQKELEAKFEALPKKPVDEYKDEEAKATKEQEDLLKAWEKWAKGSVAELAKLPTGFVDDFQMRADVNKIFEEIEKAANRPKAEKIEVALEDLGAGLATKMLEDLEMWMPDAPDAAKWVLEEPLDKKPMKIPEMSLPTALEDMIGDLIQKADEFDEEADDVTSAWGDNLNQAGWGVADGPISSFSAKGKTGNDLPNNMEIGGRSGDGRRGKSSGQMVGDTARALQGRKTPARVNNERYEPGQLKQEGRSDPNGSTGGGKKAGSGRKGLQGGTPPDFVRDIGRLTEKQAGIRDKADQVAKKLESSGVTNRRLTESITLMKSAEQDLRDLRYQDAARKRRVSVGLLKSALTDQDPATAAQLSRARDLPPQLRTELLQAADEGYPPGYESLLKSYFKALSSADQAPGNNAP